MLQNTKEEEKIKIIKDILKQEPSLWNKNENKFDFDFHKLLNKIEKYDKDIISLLFQNDTLKEYFFVKIGNTYIFKNNEFRFFIEGNKLADSFTKYKNIIGLTDTKHFIKDNNDIVLEWPYKDCIFAGNQEDQTKKQNELFFNQVIAKNEIIRLLDNKCLVNWTKYNGVTDSNNKELTNTGGGNAFLVLILN